MKVLKIFYPDQTEGTLTMFGEKHDPLYETFRYPGGEAQVRFTEHGLIELDKADEVHVVARVQNGEIMELALLADALHNNFSGTTTLILPYLPYSRADRRFVNGDCSGLKVFGSMVDNMRFNKVVTLDTHSNKARIEVSNLVNVSPEPLINVVLNLVPQDTMILYPDEGASRRYKIEDRPFLSATKVRDPKTGTLTGFNVPSVINRYKNVMIVDDICDGGGTFLGIAKEIDVKVNLYLYVTHGIFSKGLTDLRSQFNQIFTSNSGNWFSRMNARENNLTVIPAMGLIESAILTPGDLWLNAEAL